MVYEKTIFVDTEQAKKLQNLLDIDEIDFEEMNIAEDSTLASFSAKFDNGLFADVNVCSGQHNCWADAILYAPDGTELVVCEPSDVLLGESRIEYNGDTYIVTLESM